MRRDRPTLLRRLLVALLPALLLLAAVGAAQDYFQVRELADEAYDAALASTAIGLAARLESDRDSDLPVHLSALAQAVARRNPEIGLQYVVMGLDGATVSGRTELAALASPPGPQNPGFRDAVFDGQPLRVATYRYAGPDGQALIVVAEGLEARADAARRAVGATVWSNLAMVVAVLGVVTFGVRAALTPLHALGARASGHDADTLQALAVSEVPQEVRPLVDGMNRLIEKLRLSTQAQQAFLNNSAHQLRTPLAGAQAQLELLIDDACGSPLQPRLQSLGSSIRRLTRLTQQMLALARTDASAQDNATAQAAEAVDLQALLQELAAEQLDAALERQVDLGLETDAAVTVGQRWMLRELVANLVDNALHHAPAHSQVTLRCGADDGSVDAVYLEVEDDGPGIAPEQRQRVFERFVRLSQAPGPGSGLGLAIVREVAQAHRARVQILDGLDGRGTRVRVTFGRGPGRKTAYRR